LGFLFYVMFVYLAVIAFLFKLKTFAVDIFDYKNFFDDA